ncbi:hypothetical protein [Paenibacillus sp. UNC451MF]|uniref:hypothetical protein n=1 Tax=Paenibacillus sp. UNC451MF TaxID=1449063 RepID=UPI000AB5C719|nr:hypothetical protein [Paenibacillus sp. UNC451MF]
MSLLLPITTFVLIVLGAFCLFMSIENDRVIRATRRKPIPILPAAPTVSFSKRTDP